MAILLVGFIAIVGALVYRAYRDGDAAASRYALETVSLPAGAELLSASTTDSVVTLAYRLDGKTMIRILDLKSGEAVGQIEVTSD